MQLVLPQKVLFVVLLSLQIELPDVILSLSLLNISNFKIFGFCNQTFIKVVVDQLLFVKYNDLVKALLIQSWFLDDSVERYAPLVVVVDSVVGTTGALVHAVEVIH
jgi:hypothetical protein